MYRNQDRDSSARIRVVAVPEAQPIAQAELANVDSANVDLAKVDEAPAPPTEAQAPAPPTARQTLPDAAPQMPLASDRPQRRSRRKLVFGAIAILAAGVGGWFGYDYVTVGRFTVSTDDAYVQAYNTTLAAKVAGYVASVPVTDNTYVHIGDVIATIDDGDYKLAVDFSTRKSRDPGGDGRPHGASDHRPGSGGGADAHPACLRASRRQAHGARTQSPERTGGARLVEPPVARTGAS